jgi:CheY-like chemotaxis protein
VTLPVRAVAVPKEEPASVQAPAPQCSEPVSLHGVKILAVDDDPDARDLLEDVLAGAGAIVETAESAAAGLRAVQRFRPHILVSDIGMPEEDGYSFVRRLHSLQPADGGGIPSIALTAYTGVADRTKALAAGFTTHIGKPVNPNDLVAAVANLAAFVRR